MVDAMAALWLVAHALGSPAEASVVTGRAPGSSGSGGSVLHNCDARR